MPLPSKRKIPFFNYSHVFSSHKEEYLKALERTLSKGTFIMGNELAEFEASLAKFLGVKHAFGIADGTMALIIGLKASDIGPGAEVIVPSHTFVASVAAIRHAGAQPVLADCGEDHLVSIESVRGLITEKTRAIMPVHLNGRTANMESIVELSRRKRIKIIEDACQALGSKYKNQCAGTFGQAGALSFYPSKTLGCFGDGGAIVTNDDRIAESIMWLRDHGRTSSGELAGFGFNARLDNIQAAILNIKLSNYHFELNRRRELAEIYTHFLKDVEELKLPPAPNEHGDHFDIFQNYEIEAKDRDKLKENLMLNGVGCSIQWGGKAVHQFKKLGFNCHLPNTDRLFERCLLLPMNSSLMDEDVAYISQIMKSFYARA
jgi:dTDP-4-amino-4,6-dideoxygalactose transaminase